MMLPMMNGQPVSVDALRVLATVQRSLSATIIAALASHAPSCTSSYLTRERERERDKAV